MSRPLSRSGWRPYTRRRGDNPRAMDAVVLIPNCVECGAVWLPAHQERWAAYLTDDEPPEFVVYCPECAEREFK